MISVLVWIDVHVLQCKWRWLCDWVWDQELARDSQPGGKLDRMAAAAKAELEAASKHRIARMLYELYDTTTQEVVAPRRWMTKADADARNELLRQWGESTRWIPATGEDDE